MPLKRLIRLNRFVRAFDDLDVDIQKIAEKQFHFFIEKVSAKEYCIKSMGLK